MRPLWGEAHLTSRFETSQGRSLTLKASAESFSQVNPAAASLAYRAVVEALAPHEGLRALDLYCGVGSITLALAQAGCAEVVGLEESPSSVRDAQENALSNELEARFEAGLTEERLPAWVDKLSTELPLLRSEGSETQRRAVVVSLNPSRRGCQASVLDELARLSPQRLAYMSCHPRSLMRDLKRLAKRGYQPTRVQLFDLFPGTPHYEVVCALS
jgi:23S rRNA (uracil1939-C5)-methyltransferase